MHYSSGHRFPDNVVVYRVVFLGKNLGGDARVLNNAVVIAIKVGWTVDIGTPNIPVSASMLQFGLGLGQVSSQSFRRQRWPI
jgi:hypothetical protein